MVDPVTIFFKLDEMSRFLETAPDGCIVEVGVFEGGSLYYMATRNPFRQFYGYDTFDGMPEPCSLDNFHKAGDFKTTLEAVQSNLAGVTNVKLIQGLYPQSDTIFPAPIALAHVDVDLYTSTYDAFRHLLPLMAKGGRIYCDDSFTLNCHGATLALCRFCHETSLVPHVGHVMGMPITYIQV